MISVVACIAGLAAKPVAAECTLSTFAKLPVTFVGWRPLVATKINGANALFIVNSSAAFSYISAASLSEYGLSRKPLPDGARVFGLGQGQIYLTTIKYLNIAGSDVPNVEFVVGGGEIGGGAVGAIGQNILALADTDYNLGRGEIQLERPSGCIHKDLAYWTKGAFYAVMPLYADYENHFTIGRVTINGFPFRALLDTGSRSSIISADAARRASIKNLDPDPIPSRPWTGHVAEFEFGGEKIINTVVMISPGNFSEDYDLVLGLDFFLSHHIFIATSQHKAFITYSGGPVFDLKSTPLYQHAGSDGDPTSVASQLSDSADSDPRDADGFSRRGAAFAVRLEYEKAIADFTKACEMKPDEPMYYYQRASARIRANQLEGAMADLSTAIKLNPHSPML